MPRKMSSMPVMKVHSNGNRDGPHDSSTPCPTSQPTCLLTGLPKKSRLSPSLSLLSSSELQTCGASVQPRSYSRTQRPSLPSGKVTPNSSHRSSGELLPQSDLLLSQNQQSGNHDLSSILHQLHTRNYSTQAPASVDAVVSSNKESTPTSLPLSRQHPLSKSETSTSLTIKSLKLTPQRQLMKPIGPPMPRSKTMGNLSCFAGDATAETLSPLKSEPYSLNSGSKKERDVVCLIRCSRTTDNNVEVYEHVTKQNQMDEQRIQQIGGREKPYSSMDPRRFLDPNSMTRNLVQPQVRFRQSHVGSRKGFGKINITKNEEMDLKLLRRDYDHRREDQIHPVSSIASGDSCLETKLANITQQPRTLSMRSDSGKMTGSNPEDKWDVDVKLVYLGQGITYWMGRFSTLCDRLKTARARLIPSNFNFAPTSTSFQGILDTKEPFEVAECRQREYALKELRSYCRTNAALRSFEKFEIQLRRQLEKCAEAQSKLAQVPLIRPVEDFVPGANSNSESKLRFGWHIGHGRGSNAAGGAIDLESAIDNKQRPIMSKTKTTSNLTSILDGDKSMKATANASASGISDVTSLPQFTWQRPTVYEAQAQARRIRTQRVVAKAVVYRRASGQEGGFGTTLSGGGNSAATDSQDAVGSHVGKSCQENELISVDAYPAANGGHCRKISGTDSLRLKKVLSDSMTGMRKIKRSLTGSRSVSRSERLIN